MSHGDRALNSIKTPLKERHGIEHTTIQVEPESYREVGEVRGGVES